MMLRRFFFGVMVLGALPFTVQRGDAQLLGPPASGEQIVVDATNVLAMTAADPAGIPQKLLADAQAIAIVPNMVRGAFVVGLQHGRGVLLTRDAAGAWQPPRMIQITGGSIGYQIGVQSTDLILVFRTPQSVTNLMSRTIKIGVDASAAAGPVGRSASAATDLPLQAEILSYSRARGAFIGVSIDGSSVALDPAADALYYQPPGTVPGSAVQLIQMATAYSAGGVVAIAAPTSLVVPPAAGEVEAARQQLDVVSRQLAGHLDAEWKRYLALPAEVYMPQSLPSPQLIQEAAARYEDISRRPEYSALTSRPEFQETLRALWKMSEVQQRATKPLELPPPPK